MPSITSTQLNQQLHAPSFLTEEDTTTKNQILNRHRESNHSIRLCHIFLWGFTRKTCIFCIFFLVRYHRTHAAIYCICFCLYVALFDGNYVHGFDKKKQASNQQQYFCLLQRMDGSYGGGNRTDAHIQPPPRVSAISIFSTVHPNFEMHWALWHLEFNSQYACRTK